MLSLWHFIHRSPATETFCEVRLCKSAPLPSSDATVRLVTKPGEQEESGTTAIFFFTHKFTDRQSGATILRPHDSFSGRLSKRANLISFTTASIHSVFKQKFLHPINIFLFCSTSPTDVAPLPNSAKPLQNLRTSRCLLYKSYLRHF